MPTDEIVRIISTPFFWIVSAIGSIILGVVGNLVTPRAAHFLQARSQMRQHHERRAAARLLGEIIIRFDDPYKHTQTKLDSIYSLLLACVFMLFSLVIFTIAGSLEWLLVPIIVRIAISISGIPVLWLALFCTRNGMKFRRITNLVEQRQKALASIRYSMSDNSIKFQKLLDEWDLENIGITMKEIKNAI